MSTKKLILVLAIVFLAAIGLKVILSRRSSHTQQDSATPDDGVQVINT
jgi:hypothetical protein